MVTLAPPAGWTSPSIVAPGDTGGLIYWLGTNGKTQAFANPHPAILTVSASTQLDTAYSPPKATDRTTSTFYASGGNIGDWWRVTLPEPMRLTGYTIQGRASGTHLRNWNVEGSNDGTTWTVIDQRVNDPTMVAYTDTVYFAVSTATAFTQLRIRTTGSQSDSTQLCFAEAEFYGEYAPAPAATPVALGPTTIAAAATTTPAAPTIRARLAATTIAAAAAVAAAAPRNNAALTPTPVNAAFTFTPSEPNVGGLRPLPATTTPAAFTLAATGLRSLVHLAPITVPAGLTITATGDLVPDQDTSHLPATTITAAATITGPLRRTLTLGATTITGTVAVQVQHTRDTTATVGRAYTRQPVGAIRL